MNQREAGIVAWIGGLLLTPALLLLADQGAIPMALLDVLLGLSLLVSFIVCVLAIRAFSLSAGGSTGCFLLSVVLWWLAMLGTFAFIGFASD
jgi:hypothetical protein